MSLTLGSGWQGGGGDVIQRWTVTGTMAGDGPHDPDDAVHYTETYEVVSG